MLKRNSLPLVSANTFTLLSLSTEEKKLAEEKEKVLAYMTARLILGRARGLAHLSENYKLRSSKYRVESDIMASILQNIITIFDILLYDFPYPLFYTFLSENVNEFLDVFDLRVNHPAIEKKFQDLVNGTSSAFQTEIKEKMEFRDMLENADIDCLAEDILSFIKCGASLSLSKMLRNMNKADLDKLISGLGQRMLHYAIQFRQVDVVRELLKYNIDINLAYHGITMTIKGAMPSDCAPKSALAHALERVLFDYCEIDKDKKLMYDLFQSVFEDRESFNYEMAPFQEIDIESIAKASEEILLLMLAHDIDPENLRSTVEICTQIRTGLLSPDSDLQANQLRFRSAILALMDKIIAGFTLRAEISPRV